MGKRRNFVKQRGVIAVLTAISLLAILGMAGLALDGGHTMISKTRLQNVVDAAALSAAKTLMDSSNDVVEAEAEAYAMFADAANDLGHSEINDSYTSGDLSVSVAFSNTLIPFAPGTTPANYVRVTVLDFTMPTTLMQVMGVNSIDVEVSAVAGPSVALGETCNIAPMMVCADPDTIDASGNLTDDFAGFEPGKVEVLKAGNANQAMEKGNFQLIRLADAQGGDDVRDAFAGAYPGCLETDGDALIETEPGNTVGAMRQGLNTRFGEYQGPMAQGGADAYPPDTVTTQSAGEFTYDDAIIDGQEVEAVYYNGDLVEYAAVNDWQSPLDGYSTTYYAPHVGDVDSEGGIIDDGGIFDFEDYRDAPEATTGVAGRRVIAMPVGQCGSESGQSQVPYLTSLCFFMLQSVSNGPNADVFGQFIPYGCPVKGVPGAEPINTPGPYIIQLYKDETRTES